MVTPLELFWYIVAGAAGLGVGGVLLAFGGVCVLAVRGWLIGDPPQVPPREIPEPSRFQSPPQGP